MGIQVARCHSKEIAMNPTPKHDVVIVGGGPAGSVAGIYLSRQGFDTCIIEKKKFPREIICGEFLSGEVTHSITELGLFQEFLSLNPNKISSFKIVNEKGSEIHSDLNFPAYAIKRSVFDNFLMNNAAESGATVYQQEEVVSIKRGNNTFILKLKNRDRNEDKIEANYVIGAYGKRTKLDKTLGRKFINSSSKLNGVKFHVPNNFIEDFHPNEIRIYTGEDIYCGLNRVSGKETTVCFLEKRINDKLSPRNRIINLMNTNKEFGKLFKKDFGDILYELPLYGTGDIYFGMKTLVENGIFMIGDAAGMIAPFTGDGIGMAFQSARLISSLLAEHKIKDYDRNVLEKNYISEWNKLFVKRRRIALITQKLILNKKTKGIPFALANSFSFILPKLISATRSIEDKSPLINVQKRY